MLIVFPLLALQGLYKVKSLRAFGSIRLTLKKYNFRILGIVNNNKLPTTDARKNIDSTIGRNRPIRRYTA